MYIIELITLYVVLLDILENNKKFFLFWNVH